jgi:hypothetical protein
MNKMGKGALALVVLGAALVFATAHNTGSHSTDNSLKSLSPTKSSAKKESPQPSAQPAQQKKITTKQVVETQVIPYQSIEQNDEHLEKGKTQVTAQGSNGQKNITYKVTYADGTEIAREKFSEVITTQPVNKITKIGTYVAPVVAPSPPTGPAGATALCDDGSISYAEHHQGACSKHGGVNLWYQ